MSHQYFYSLDRFNIYLKITLNYPKTAAAAMGFVPMASRSSISRGKQAISVRAIEVILYLNLFCNILSIFQNDSIPGMLFFLSGAVMLISTLLCCVFTETKDQSLEDTLNKHHATPEIQVFAMTGVTKQQQSAGNEKSSDTETGVCFIRL